MVHLRLFLHSKQMMRPNILPVLVFVTTATVLVSSEVSSVCDKEDVTCTDNDLVKIYWSLNGLKQDDPALIEVLKNEILIPPDGKELNMLGPMSSKRLRGQYEQPYHAEDYLKLKKPKKKKVLIKKEKKFGFFLEAGAACGEYLSNSLYFEVIYGWTGLLVEPDPGNLEQLLGKHRDAWILPHCLSTKQEVEVVNFDSSKYNSGILLDGKPRPSRVGGKRIIDKQPYEQELKVCLKSSYFKIK
jgi:hypothetical protein